MIPVRQQGVAAGWVLHFTSLKKSVIYIIQQTQYPEA